ncbi:hypothetical protein HYR99_40650 [Candidatus Poribacteria bacterium]|nr:hypothetical protein [Candidatus Poribacteria bacterium]
MSITTVTALQKELRQLIGKLPASELHAAKRFLEYLYLAGEADDLVLQALKNAPVSNEPLTDEDRAALDEAYDDIRAGRVNSHEELKRQLGIQ